MNRIACCFVALVGLLFLAAPAEAGPGYYALDIAPPLVVVPSFQTVTFATGYNTVSFVPTNSALINPFFGGVVIERDFRGREFDRRFESGRDFGGRDFGRRVRR